MHYSPQDMEIQKVVDYSKNQKVKTNKKSGAFIHHQSDITNCELMYNYTIKTKRVLTIIN